MPVWVGDVYTCVLYAPRAGVAGSCELMVCWELNSGPLHPYLLSLLSLQPPFLFLISSSWVIFQKISAVSFFIAIQHTLETGLLGSGARSIRAFDT